MTSLTPSDSKALKADLAFIHSLYANLKMKFSFKKLSTFREALLGIGGTIGEIEWMYSKEQLDSKISFQMLSDWEARDKLNKEREYEQRDYKSPASFDHDYANVLYRRQESKQEEGNKQSAPHIEPEREEYPILSSPLQKANLFKFQNKAAWQIIHKVVDPKTLILQKRAVLLRAGVGVGKTFVLAAVLRFLEDLKLRQHYKIVSPWPIVWITRASIVEQTKRVCKDLFGLDTYATLQVINIEQLRARFGDWMIAWETKVEGGEEHIICKWKPLIHPFIFVIDECQLAKNEDSTQAKIIAAIAEIPSSEPVIVICSSATPFTRVSEAGYFCKNTWKNI